MHVLTDSTLPDFLPFANREPQLQEVIDFPGKHYFAFEGPPGSGKTALLQKVQGTCHEPRTSVETVTSWQGILVNVSMHDDLMKKVYNSITETLHIPVDNNAGCEKAGRTVGFLLAKKFGIQSPTGIYILVDFDFPIQRASTIEPLVSHFLPALFLQLRKLLTNFNIGKKFLVVLSSRSFSSECRRFLSRDGNSKYLIRRLSPLDYTNTHSLCNDLLSLLEQPIQDIQQVNEFAAHLYFYSKGHPLLVRLIFQAFLEAKAPPEDFFNDSREVLHRIVHVETAKIQKELARDWQQIFEELCIYRLFDKGIVADLRASMDNAELKASEFDVFDWIDQWNAAGIIETVPHTWLYAGTRHKLLSYEQFLVNEQNYLDHSSNAKFLCLERMQKPSSLCTLWAMEATYHYLQSHIHIIHDRKKREDLQTDFFDSWFPNLVKLLLQNNTHLGEACFQLGKALERDEELQFMINYYLRGNDFSNTNSIFDQLLQKLPVLFNE
jgi:hypothetical protein